MEERATQPLRLIPGDGCRQKAMYRIPEAMRLLSLSRSVIYEQIRAGRLRTVTQGRTRLVSATAIAEYVALLESEASERKAA
ncbi:DNA binding domain-containing protein, excisionase family [Asanoa hainanensis]|uniref:DNA binding domain-containing protein, excisionase family n=2 Tax=Asanoa hainanensis TaxID=560556 RepID=A0A239LI16_9ACTN|nr:DNA binding domain-containing protein, excisionase family [Asanoa hainanensis]